MKKVTSKLKDSLTNNVSLKLIAILIAAIVWLVVVNVNDPEKTILVYSIPVTVVDEEAVTDMDMVYSITSGNYVNVTISGKRSVLNSITAADFVATASLKELSKVNAVPIEVTTKDPYLANRVTIEKQSEHSLIVELEDVEQDTFDIEVEYKGNAATGFIPGDSTLSTKTIDIKAPASVLDKIDRVVAVCKLDGNDEDFTKSCRIKLYDRKNKRISGNNIKLSMKNVEVSVELLYGKEVPLVVETIGNPDDGYTIKSVTTSIDTVYLLAEKEILDGIDRLSIDPDISLVDETEDVIRTIDLISYLPQGVSIQGETTVDIIIDIAELTKKTFTLGQEEIQIENKPNQLTMKLLKDVKITLKGDAEVLDSISNKDFNATIDLNNKKSGKSQVEVVITIPDGAELVEKVNASIELIK